MHTSAYRRIVNATARILQDVVNRIIFLGHTTEYLTDSISIIIANAIILYYSQDNIPRKLSLDPKRRWRRRVLQAIRVELN